MKLNKLNETELIKIGCILQGSFDLDLLSKTFPVFVEFIKEVDQDKINEVITEEALKIEISDNVTIKKSDYIMLYAHTVALLEPAEFNQRYPGLRALLLNVLSQDELNSTLTLVDQIKKRYLEF